MCFLIFGVFEFCSVVWYRLGGFGFGVEYLCIDGELVKRLKVVGWYLGCVLEVWR